MNWYKKPTLKGWQDLRLTELDLPDHFNGRPLNIGALLGKPSGGLTDGDLDAPEPLSLASHFLPGTHSRFGRAGKPNSHWEYITDPVETTSQFEDLDGTMLVEYRSTGGHTIFPGSIHPSGEPIEWVEDGEPPQVDGRFRLMDGY